MHFTANGPHCFHKHFFIYGFLFFSAASCINQTAGEAQPAREENLLQAYEVLHQRLQALTDQDNTYAGLLNNNVPTSALDESSGRIIQAEMELQRTIDSLEKGAANAQNAGLEKITDRFKALLQSRRLLSDMRMALSAGSDDSTNAQQMLMRLRADLRNRDEKIATLEKTAMTATNNTQRSAPPAKSENAEQLRQRNKTLQESLRAMETKYFTVGRNYLLLQKQHERTVNELAALRKANGQQ